MLKPTVLFFMLTFALALHAQERKLSFGVHTGATFSSIQTDWEAFDPKYRTGFFAGANVRWAISDQWSIPLDVQFAQRGFYYNTTGAYVVLNNQLTLYRGRVDYRSSYVDIVPQVAFRPMEHIGLAVGPYMSLRTAEAVRYGDVIDWTDTKSFSLFKDTDFGLSAKLSGHFGHVSVFAAYQFGLASISDIELTDENGQSLGTLQSKNRAILVGAGWQF